MPYISLIVRKSAMLTVPIAQVKPESVTLFETLLSDTRFIVHSLKHGWKRERIGQWGRHEIGTIGHVRNGRMGI